MISDAINTTGKLKLDDVSTVYEESAEEINKVNKVHDKEVATISKEHAIVDVFNVAAKENVIEVVKKADQAGIDVEDVIAEANLPFEVDTEDKAATEELAVKEAIDTLGKIVCKHKGCLKSIKKDPELNDVLTLLVDDFLEKEDEDEEEDDYEEARPERIAYPGQLP